MDQLHGGIDRYTNNSVLVLVDEQEQVVFEKRIPNDLKKNLLQLNPYHSLVHGLVVESTYN